MKPLRLCLPLLAALSLSACHSHVISAHMVNASSAPISGIIIDYPGATFGKDKLLPGQEFRYTFKPVDNGNLKIEFTNAAGKTFRYPGPLVHKDDEGAIEITFTQEDSKALARLTSSGK